MGGLGHFLTSPGGLVAAIAVVVAIVAGVVSGPVAVVWRRRDKKRAALASEPDLQIGTVEVSELAPWSATRDLRFTLANCKGGTGVLTALRLLVVERREIAETRPTYPGAAMTVRQHRVELKPGVETYDIRARLFTTEQPPLRFPAGEVEPFLVKIVAQPGNRYSVRIDAEWYDVQKPDKRIETHTDPLTLTFPLEEPQAKPLVVDDERVP